ncbi:MAG: site-specific integrase, partial [Patescibacteria group bacterium]
FLKELKLLKPRSAIDRNENRERMKVAEQIKNKRELQLQSDEYQVTPDFKKNIDFVRFFQNYLNSYTKKDKRVMSGCFNKLKEFMKEESLISLTTKQVNEALVSDFKEYLEQTLNGETPANYFKKFKKVLKYGVREKIFSVNPAQELTAKRNEGIKKEILTFDEIQKLAKTACTNDDMKRAFLFSCLTGLRFCDIKILQWKNINGKVLKVTQQKTSKPVSINLNENGLEILGKTGKSNELVFKIPSNTACRKNLLVWCKNAGVKKKITWHCARHSFATNIIFYGSDVNSASSLLGHSSLAYTQRYVRVVESLKEKAVDSLPSLKL